MKANIFSNKTFIGYISSLKIGDYTMGGLYGIFTPNNYYLEELQYEIQAFNQSTKKDFSIWDTFNFEVRILDDITLTPPVFIIEDHIEFPEEPIIIEIAGVDCELIDRYFEQ